MSTICFVASKSGGHLLPCVTLAHRYKKQDIGHTLAIITGTGCLDRSVVDDHPVFDEKLSLFVPPFLYRQPWRWPSFFVSALSVAWRSYQFLSFIKADRLISTGGLIGIPVSIAAFFLGIPIELYELNATPGKAIRLLSFIATSIKVTFEQSLSYFKNAQLVFYPLSDLEHIAPQQARKHLGLSIAKKTITIIGGSQGSVFINRLWTQWIIEHADTLKEHYSIIHQHGGNENWSAFYAQYGIEAYTSTFIKQMSFVYSASSCIIARAGAGSLFEIVEFNIPALIIPLAHRISSHQYDNAQAIAQLHSFVHVVSQESIEKDISNFDRHLNLLLIRSI